MEAEAPPRALELSALEAEKEPMAAARGGEEEEEEDRGGPPHAPPSPGPDPAPQIGEKNGLVKIPPDEELGGGGEISGGCKFTGLGKEELLRAAGTPPWAKARAILLLLFWLGWLGMLGAAAAIVARAPRCRPLPPRAWWQLGGLYRAPPQGFAENLKGVAAQLPHVAELQMRGLVLGPLHPEIRDPQNFSLEELDPGLGSLQDLNHLLEVAKKEGLEVILDVTPNSWGERAWFNPDVAENPKIHEKVKRALSVWLERGVAGFFVDGIEELPVSVVAEWRNLTEQSSADGGARVLVGGTRLRDPPALRALLNSSGVGLVLGRFLEALGPPGPQLAPELLGFLHPNISLAWSVGTPREHLAGLSPPLAPQRLLLLWALPGTPVLSYGDEVGLSDPPADPPGAAPRRQLTQMPWDLVKGKRDPGGNGSQVDPLEMCRRLSALWVQERSLSLGDAVAIPAAPATAFLRIWDQSKRFLVVLNPGEVPIPSLALEDSRLPARATLHISTHRLFDKDPEVDLKALELLPYEGLLLSFPYAP